MAGPVWAFAGGSSCTFLAGGETELKMLKELAGKLSPKVYEATSEQRKYLHIAAVFAFTYLFI